MESIIHLSELSKRFSSGFSALQQINLQIEEGEYIAIVGKSGSGKSTLLNMISGIDHPSEGSVRCVGTELSHLNESQLARWRGKHIGIVFQFFQLIPTLSVTENLLLAMEFVDIIPKAQRLPRAMQLLAQMDIADQADKLPATLSGGQQQRAAIARALANDPPIIIADEPTGNLDSLTAAAIHQGFRSLASAGKTVIVVTHETQNLQRYDRTILLTDGQIVSSNKQTPKA